MTRSARSLLAAGVGHSFFHGPAGTAGCGIPASPAPQHFQVIGMFGLGTVVQMLNAAQAILIRCHLPFLRIVDIASAQNLPRICLPSLKEQTCAISLFLRSAPRCVEIYVFTGITTPSTRSASVNLTGFVVDVGALTSFRRDVSTVGRFVGTSVVGTVPVLQMTLGGVIRAVVFVAGVALALAEAVRSAVSVSRFEADVVDGLGRVLVGHDGLHGSKFINARRAENRQLSATRVSIGTITAEDITGDVDVPGTASRRLRRNTVIPRVRLETHGWEEVPLDAIAIPAYVTVDGGSRPTELTFPLVQQVDQGAQLGLYAMWNGRELDGIVLPAKVYAIGYRPGDCLTVDIPEASLNARDVVVRNREIEGSTMGVTLTCRSETFAKHAFCLGKTGNAPPTPDLSVPPAYPIETTRAAYQILEATQSVAYPVTSTSTTVSVAAFEGTIDDGRRLSFPSYQATGLAESTTYIVLWNIAAASYSVPTVANAYAQIASPEYVIVRYISTSAADGTYPSQPTAPGGDGGGGYGGGGRYNQNEAIP